MMIVLLTPPHTLRGKNLGSSKAHKSGGAPGVTLAQAQWGAFMADSIFCATLLGIYYVV